MAELDTSGGGKKGGKKVRSKKQSTRVDLTAMVDLAFLLITFFMLTTTLAKSKAMDLGMPNKDDKTAKLTVADDRTITILLGAHDRLEWYMGTVDKPKTPTVTNYSGKDGIQNVLIEKKKEVIGITGDPEKGLIVLIKPTDNSSYKNLVDVLDFIKVAGVNIQSIGDITPPEIELLKRDGIYNK
jgi:biopolymer transport protein ExbD